MKRNSEAQGSKVRQTLNSGKSSSGLSIHHQDSTASLKKKTTKIPEDETEKRGLEKQAIKKPKNNTFSAQNLKAFPSLEEQKTQIS